MCGNVAPHVICIWLIARAAQTTDELPKRINRRSARKFGRQRLSKSFDVGLSLVIKERPIRKPVALIEVKERATANAASSNNDDKTREVKSAHNA